MILTIHRHVISRIPRYSITYDNANTWLLHVNQAQQDDRGYYMCQVNWENTNSKDFFVNFCQKHLAVIEIIEWSWAFWKTITANRKKAFNGHFNAMRMRWGISMNILVCDMDSSRTHTNRSQWALAHLSHILFVFSGQHKSHDKSSGLSSSGWYVHI